MGFAKLFIPACLTVSLVMAFSLNGYAIDERYAASPLDGSKGQVKKDSFSLVKDTVHFNPTLKPLQVTNSVRSIITFRINEFSTKMLPSSFAVTAKVKMEYVKEILVGGTLQDVTFIDSVNLLLSYDATTQHVNRANYTMLEVYQMKVTVMNVTATSGTLSQFDSVLVIDNELIVNREYDFSCSNDTIQNFSKDTSAVSPIGELHVTWSKNRAADEYDLEWTYIDSSALSNYLTGGNYDAKKIFANNATRVSIKPEEYFIPLLYDNKGSLFFRVRAVQIKYSGQRKEANWSALKQYDFNGHERKLNWQASTSFAEDGKRKSVVQYFDGSLRNRQTVTKDNTTNTTVVAETFYDNQGRPAIQVLPAPTLNTIIQYTASFNKFNGAEYAKSLYDPVPDSAGAYCAIGAPEMDTASGASRYYSSNNPLRDSGFHKFIPDAEGYPFTETRYTLDNTGRISMQSGVGKEFRIRPSDSIHATKYYYSSADPEELTALFGTEIGHPSHYFKNMVRDANGQYSVSYADMHGRTIATALAGYPKANLDTLRSNISKTITKKLIDSGNNFVKGTAIESSKSLVVTLGGNHRFIYSLAPDSIRINDCQATTVCYDCLYDLEITINDEECNNSKFGGNPLKIARSNVKLDSMDIACNANQSFPGIDTTIYLTEGSYLVTKRLTLSKPGKEYYDSVFLARNTCKTPEQFIQEQKTVFLQQAACNPTCQSCLDSLKTWSQFRSDYMLELGISAEDSASYRMQALEAYERKKADCDVLCENRGLHHSIREQMLADITPPFGQYANPDKADARSIFYQFENTYPYQKVNGDYLDENGKTDYILNALNVPVKPTDGSVKPVDFIQGFKESWLPLLLTKHPEYGRLLRYEELAASHLWDERFANVTTFKAAVDSGFLNPGNFTTHPSGAIFNYNSAHRDPFFTDLSGGLVPSGYKTLMNDSLVKKANPDGTWISAWALATLMAHCDTANVSCYNTYRSDAYAFSMDTACSGELDAAWKYFREMYLQEKSELVYKIISAVPMNSVEVPPHFLNFPDPNVLPSDNPLTSSAGKDSLNVFIKNNCAAYVQQWWDELSPCGFNSADTAVIFPRLRQVCEEGGDKDHIFGSATIKPSSTYTFSGFDAVLKHFCDSAGRSYNANCNGYLITAPRPYDQQPVYFNKPVFQKPDSCECASINSYYTQYQAAKLTGENFAAYLKRLTGISMYNGVLDTLRSVCNGSINCRFLKQPPGLPAIFQCGVKDVCVSCAKVQDLFSQYKTAFPSALPVYDDNDSTQRFYNRLFENFMNSKLGFSNSYLDYLNFLDTCKNARPAICADLDSLQKAYTSSHTYIAHTFVPTGGYPTSLTDPKQFFINGAARLPDQYRLQPASFYRNYGLSSAYNFCFTDSGYTLEYRLKFPVENGYNHNLHIVTRNQLAVMFGQFTSGTYSGGSLDSVYLFGFWDEWAKAMGGHNGNAGFDYIPAAAVGAMDAWHTVKVKVTLPRYYIYFNNLLVADFARDSSTQLVGRYDGTTVAFLGNDGAVDWVKMYDNHDNLRFEEHFNNPLQPANPDPSAICISYNCSTAFTTYFNTAKGTSYTYSQIDSIYKACGTPFTACDADTLSCDSLSAIYQGGLAAYIALPDSVKTTTYCKTYFENYFNTRTGKNFNYEQIRNFYRQRCGLNIGICGVDSLVLCGKKEPAFPPVTFVQHTACADSLLFAVVKGTVLYEYYRDSLLNSFNDRYLAKCLNARYLESFTVQQPVSEYHYTLYYYDQAGNLVKTIPPAGVDTSKFGHLPAWMDSVRSYKGSKALLVPTHTLATNYRYNTLNQVVAQHSPDGGKTEFWYDRLGRLVLSRNAKQKWESGTSNNLFSYTKYDQLGRITEVGQIKDTVSGRTVNQALTRNQSNLDQFYLSLTNKREQITQTLYDLPYDGFAGMESTTIGQKNLRNRVSFTSFTKGTNPAQYNQATFYSYDIHGNVDTLLQDYGRADLPSLANIMNQNSTNLNRWKKIVYRYDLISGKVNHVAYNPHHIDEFYHRYNYDAENRLTNVETSLDSINWETDARYQYYKHGPLARMVMGDQMVQGMDYAYTLQGWLKGVNSISLDTAFDMGADGRSGMNRYVAKDEVGFNLNYFTGDYGTINPTVNPFPGHTAYLANADDDRPLFNGNISSMAVNIKKLIYPGVAAYHYDQLNRITARKSYYNLNQSGNSWSGLTPTQSFEERFSYDANGNILKADRYTGATWGGPMDSLSYSYYPNTNRLRRVRDFGGNYYFVPPDVTDQASSDNYKYDSIGNLTSDVKENIDSIRWSVYGKILEIHKTATTDNPVTKIVYTYDAAGNRISKTVWKNNTSTVDYTWYARDAQGNLMAAYTATGSNSDLSQLALITAENPIYGSSRLGMIARNQDAEQQWFFFNNQGTLRGNRQYELTNHLGNVLATISDHKEAVASSNPSVVSHYNAIVQNAFDYYAGGMIMPDRKFNGPNYRFGFNGKENDNEVKGFANEQDYGMRIYDPRLGRWLSIDPLTSFMPYQSPYVAMDNNPINIIDPTGMVGEPVTHTVSRGDTYASISRRYGVSIEDLRKWNKYRDKEIPIGAEVRLNDPDKRIPSPSLINLINRGASANQVKVFQDYQMKEANSIMDQLEQNQNYKSAVNSAESRKFGGILYGFGKGSMQRAQDEITFNNNFRKTITVFRNDALKATAIGLGIAVTAPIAIEGISSLSVIYTEKSIEFYVVSNLAAHQIKRKIIIALIDAGIALYGRQVLYRKEFWTLSAEAQRRSDIITTKTIEWFTKQLGKYFK